MKAKDIPAPVEIGSKATAQRANVSATPMPALSMMMTEKLAPATPSKALSPVAAAVSVMHPEAIFHPAPIRRLAPAIPTKAGKKSGAARAVRLLARPAMIMPFQAAPAPATNRI